MKWKKRITDYKSRVVSNIIPTISIREHETKIQRIWDDDCAEICGNARLILDAGLKIWYFLMKGECPHIEKKNWLEDVITRN